MIKQANLKSRSFGPYQYRKRLVIYLSVRFLVVRVLAFSFVRELNFFPPNIKKYFGHVVISSVGQHVGKWARVQISIVF